MVGTAMKTFTTGALELSSMSHTWEETERSMGRLTGEEGEWLGIECLIFTEEDQGHEKRKKKMR